METLHYYKYGEKRNGAGGNKLERIRHNLAWGNFVISDYDRVRWRNLDFVVETDFAGHATYWVRKSGGYFVAVLLPLSPTTWPDGEMVETEHNYAQVLETI